ncbi:DNA repair protein XRCC4 [Megalops cyprinoides]|uniref:DNA repair protein XRCC4 n=1 Tax=Megalops cyprinoides TaxID=118141 RepID=UPI001865133F|nr:DNA repair protein XRCC4 [Megalops cyprinoides]
MDISVRQINVSSEPGRSFFLKVTWTDDLGAGFAVVLCDGAAAWHGKVSEEDVTREAEEMEVRREKYIQDLRLALTEEGQQTMDYTFQLSPDSGCAGGLHLSYEKVQKDIAFRLGSVELRPVPAPAEVVKELISHGLGHITQLQAKNRHLQEENRQLRQEQDHITAEMERYVHGKESLEKELYTRFVLLLNEKKAKIRRLQETVRQLQDEVDEKEQREVGVGKSSALEESGVQGGSGSPEGSEYGGSTDEEQPESPHQSQKPPKATVRVVPGTSSMDDSFTDIINVMPSRKRRQRHLQDPGSESKTPSLELQRRESKETARSKEEANQKAAKRATPITAANVDPDDLFDDL